MTMSLSSTPSFLTAATTAVIAAAAADCASATVGFWTMTPMHDVGDVRSHADFAGARDGDRVLGPWRSSGRRRAVARPLTIGPTTMPTTRLAAAVIAIARPK